MTDSPPLPAPEPLRHCVERSIRYFLSTIDNGSVQNLHALVISEVENALIETVMEYTQDNLSLSAQILGLSRVTLRKKIKQQAPVEKI